MCTVFYQHQCTHSVKTEFCKIQLQENSTLKYYVKLWEEVICVELLEDASTNNSTQIASSRNFTIIYKATSKHGQLTQ